MEFSKQQLKFFKRAEEVAKESNFYRYHLGCIAVLKNKIIAASPNKLKTHTVQAKYDVYREFNCRSDPKNIHSLHAEIACLNMIKQDVCYKDIEIYIVRLLRDGSLGMARPCPSCFQYIKQLGIRKIFYSTNMGYSFETIF